MDKSELDELRAGWEQVREKVKALQLTARFYAERNQQLIDENRGLKAKLDAVTATADARDEVIDHLKAGWNRMDELLWWVTALAWSTKDVRGLPEFVVSPKKLHDMLATQGYTRENLEKR